ncbi:ORF073L [Rock bream iridovirus]|uniref:ORF073L n=2 Tax=Infectious spleen and kidney necrosis virus TaxID=180170 RepID=Q5YF14_ISKNV|nr:ORF073L [Rock bream iridovirus]AMM72710.1 ORF083L [giant sea perch iridovirus - K1]
MAANSGLLPSMSVAFTSAPARNSASMAGTSLMSEAWCRAVSWLLLRALTRSLGLCNRATNTSHGPPTAAIRGTRWPCAWPSLGSAPMLNSACTAPALPASTATISGVKPSALYSST